MIAECHRRPITLSRLDRHRQDGSTNKRLSAVYPIGELFFEFGPSGTLSYGIYFPHHLPTFRAPFPVTRGRTGLYAHVKDTYALG